jgi:hypothetical protein
MKQDIIEKEASAKTNIPEFYALPYSKRRVSVYLPSIGEANA